MPLKNKSAPRLLGLGLALFCLQSGLAQNTVPVQGAVSAAVVQVSPSLKKMLKRLPACLCVSTSRKFAAQS